MPGFNPDKINIHELAIEEPEKAQEDFGVEVTPDDWNQMREKLEEYGDRSQNVYYMPLALSMKLLNPDEGILLTPERRGRLEDVLVADRMGQNWVDFFWEAITIKTLSDGADLGENESVWQDLKEQFPGIENRRKNQSYKRWNSLGDLAKGFFKFQEKLPLPSKRNFDDARKDKDWPRFAWFAMCAKAGTLGKFAITDKGLQIVKKPAIKENKIPPLPETKQF